MVALSAPPGTRSNEIIAAANAYTAKTSAPTGCYRLLADPGHVDGLYAAGSRYLSLLGGACMSFYDWYCDLPPAIAADLGRADRRAGIADWYNAGFLMLWGSNVPADAHARRALLYRGSLQGHEVGRRVARLFRSAKFSDMWLQPKQGTDAALAHGMGHVILREYPSRPAGGVFRGLCRRIYRHADAGRLEEGRWLLSRPAAARCRFQGRAGREEQSRLEDRRHRRGTGQWSCPTGRSASAGASRASGT